MSLKILIISDNLVDFPPATSVCARLIAEGLANRGAEVSAFTTKVDPRRGNADLLNLRIFESENIHYYAHFMHEFGGSQQRFAWSEIYARCVRVLDKIAKKLTSYDNFDAFACRANRVEVTGIVRELDPDVMISFSAPFSAHRLAHEVKKATGATWVAYLFDPYAFNYTFSKALQSQRIKEEASILGDADLIVCADGVAEHDDCKRAFDSLAHKTVSLPIPGLYLPDSVPIVRKRGQRPISLVYCGIFYPGIRNPEPLLEYLERSSLDIQLELYGDIGLRSKAIFKRHPAACERIVFHGFADKHVCEKACSEADILVNVDNDIPNQIPSKVLSYMASGRPILNICDERVSPSARYLKDYPLVCHLTKQSLKAGTGVEKADNFCRVSHPCLDVSELQKALAPLATDAIIDELAGLLKVLRIRGETGGDSADAGASLQGL